MKINLKIMGFLLSFFLCVMGWGLFTELGFKTLLQIAKPLVPGKLEVENIQGTFFKKITLQGLAYENGNTIFKAKQLEIKSAWFEITNKGLKLENIRIEEGFIALNQGAKPFTMNITLFRGHVNYQPFQEMFDLTIHEFYGVYHHQPLFLRGALQWKEGVFDFQKIFVEWGKFRIKLEPNKTEKLHSLHFYLPFENKNPHYGWGTVKFQKNQVSIETLDLLQANKKVLTCQGSIYLPEFSLQNSFSTQKIQGSYQAELQDLTPIYRIVPVISRLKAKPVLQGEFSGTMSKPRLSLDANVGNAIFSIPKQKVTVKNFCLNIRGILGEGKEILTIESTGTLGEQPFTLGGEFQPFKPGTPAALTLKGHRLRILNSPTQFILASPDLIMHYQDKVLEIQGNVDIDEANIIAKDEKAVVISDDVLWVGERNQLKETEGFKVIPNISVRIDENARFKGYGLDALVKGNMKIAKRKDGMYIGDGEITFTQGKYRLPNGMGHIRKGHLFFPSGTLLSDPILDIRVVLKQTESLAMNKEEGMTVAGTLQEPILNAYSNDVYSNELLNRSAALSGFIGVGKQIAGADNQHTLSQSAVLVGGGANPIVEKIQDKLRLDEFGIQSHETKYFSTQDGNDTALVMGKALSKRIYVKYIQGVFVPSSTLRLLYFLSPRVAVSAETGSTGLGGDLSFSTERN